MEEVLPEIRDESYLVFTSRVSVAIYIEDNKKKSGERVLRPLSAGGGFFLFRIPRPFDIFVFGGAGIFMGFYRRRRRRFLKIRPLGETRMKNGGGASFFVSFLFSFSFFVLFFWTIRFCFLFFFLSREWHVFCYDGVPRPSCLSQRHTNKRATITLSLVIDSSFSQRQATERNSVKRKQLG